jgi:hypothetical protein
LVDKLERAEKHFNGRFTVLLYKFYSGLTLYAVAKTMRADKVRRFLMKLHTIGCPTATLFLAFFDAEKTFLMSTDASKVSKAYQHAIDLSSNYGFVNYEGLACERACFASIELGVDALPFVDRAIECYSTWGAHRKTRSMQLIHDALSRVAPLSHT